MRAIQDPDTRRNSNRALRDVNAANLQLVKLKQAVVDAEIQPYTQIYRNIESCHSPKKFRI